MVRPHFTAKSLWLTLATVAVFSVAASAEPLLRQFLPDNSTTPIPADETAEQVASLLAASELQVGTATIPTDALKAFYAARNYAPLWASRGKLNSEAKEALALVASAEEDALPLSHYPLAVIDELAKGEMDDRARQTALLELVTSHTLMRYAADLHQGAFAPAYSLQGKWSQEQLLQTLSQAGEAPAFLKGLLPKRPEYAALKNAYRDLRQQKNEPWPVIPAGPSIKPGASDARLPLVREALVRLGYLEEATALAAQGAAYDAAAQDAVTRLQQRSGLNADGAIGTQTFAVLNTSPGARIGQVAATMERLRWLPSQLPERHVLVNVPGYTLVATDGGAPALTMRVIVGAPKNATPLFHNVVNQVVFNPTWGVPKSIAVKEMLPKIRSNPDYLAQHSYRVLRFNDGRPQEVDPWSVDWDSLSATHFPYLLRQDAGDENALGKVKFNIPNSGAIYLHDTSQPKLFAKDMRALSHGCIRLEKPQEMARYVMAGAGWDANRTDASYTSAEPRTFNTEPVPLYLVYWTAQVDEAGKPYFHQDIYGHDAALAKKLGVGI